jgi:uncharacterized protein (TIGR01777 family)
MDMKKMSEKIIITGATGFIGKAVSHFLLENGYEIIALSRNPSKYELTEDNRMKFVLWDGQKAEGWVEYAENAKAIINLAGENIASGIWTDRKKRKILESRVKATQAILQAIKRLNTKPEVMIQASAIGYYGSRPDQVLDESSSAGKGFLADLTQIWEETASIIQKSSVRLVILRFGVALGKHGGLLPRIKPVFKSFLGGHFGSGEQYISWIHITDITKSIHYLLSQYQLKGVFNLTAPQPVSSREFFKCVGEHLHRPSWFHVPAGIIKTLMGEMAEELLLANQRVMPKRLIENDFQFNYPTLDSALSQLFDENV